MDLVDNDYAVSDDLNIIVRIKAEDEPPDIKISSPSVDSGDLPVYKSDASVSFDAANSTDPEGADLDFYWESDIDGGLGSEAKITRVLSPGVHNITLWVDDGTDGHNTSFKFRLKVLEPDDGGEDGGDGDGGEEPPVVVDPEKEGEEECGMLGLGCVFGIPVFLWLMIVILVLAAVGGVAASAISKRKREEEERKAKEEKRKRKEEKAKRLATPTAFAQKPHAGGAYVSMAGGAQVPAGYRQASGAQVAPLPIQVGYVPPSGSLRPYSHPQGPGLLIPEAPYSEAADGVGRQAGPDGTAAAPQPGTDTSQVTPPAGVEGGAVAPPSPAPHQAPTPPDGWAGPPLMSPPPEGAGGPPPVDPPPEAVAGQPPTSLPLDAPAGPPPMTSPPDRPAGPPPMTPPPDRPAGPPPMTPPPGGSLMEPPPDAPAKPPAMNPPPDGTAS
jgi:Na+-transporting methylmalonyl-CoA/oxaloacetate decarboxylase gamma subunit